MPSQDSRRLLHAAVGASGTNLALQESSSLEDAITYSRSGRRSSGLVLIAVGLLAATIALLGVYGLSAQLMHQRHREFGILMALGARDGSLLVRVLTETGQTLARGAAYGIAASIPGVFILRRYVWDLQPLDWIAVIAVPAMLSAAGLVVATLPVSKVIRRPVSELLRTM
jgi:ABC-type antimicrobial peptide transport system permease subunit